MSPTEHLYNDNWLQRHDFTLSSGEKMYYWVHQPAQKSQRLALFIHGMKGNHAGLAALAWEYKAKHPQDLILIPDLPGYGISEPFKAISEKTISSLYPQAIAELLALFDAPKNITLIGHSFGAIIGYAYLSDNQDPRVDKAYLYGIQVKGSRLSDRMLNAYRLFGLTLPKRLQTKYLYNLPLNKFESRLFTKTRDPEVRKLIYKSRIEELEAKQPATLMSSFYWVRHVNLLALPVPKHAKLTFILGAKDSMVATGPVNQLVKCNDAHCITLPDVGHYMVNEDPAHSAEVMV
jgi:pimeloyl-ACP methyl ester carboxylesterase